MPYVCMYIHTCVCRVLSFFLNIYTTKIDGLFHSCHSLTGYVIAQYCLNEEKVLSILHSCMWKARTIFFSFCVLRIDTIFTQRPILHDISVAFATSCHILIFISFHLSTFISNLATFNAETVMNCDRVTSCYSFCSKCIFRVLIRCLPLLYCNKNINSYLETTLYTSKWMI